MYCIVSSSIRINFVYNCRSVDEIDTIVCDAIKILRIGATKRKAFLIAFRAQCRMPIDGFINNGLINVDANEFGALQAAIIRCFKYFFQTFSPSYPNFQYSRMTAKPR